MRKKRVTFFSFYVLLARPCGRKVRTETKYIVRRTRRKNQNKRWREKEKEKSVENSVELPTERNPDRFHRGLT